ncbi:hypothetical protein WI89_32020 [Burkholderia ubonensis]|uniref:class I SAM-dependent methyltransferase n=1 Tax=Burkholderia ubonensis TaxID=101571 RepID=UPI00075F3ECF|nr:methyltransferase domain-containing protein [Burkholderia ubonensis]KVD77809.1 hypothetical protein WI89_32020 [Burkholderia ubonensis]
MHSVASENCESFESFERKGWQDVARSYHAYYMDLTCQSLPALLSALDVRAGTELLDVACGPGYLSATAARLGAHVIGIDFAPGMVELAKELHPAVQFEVGDASVLAFPDESFDDVGCNFGWHHLLLPEQALAEALRVLKPGGRIALTVWSRPEKAIAIGMVLAAIREHGNLDVDLPEAPPFFRFSDHDEFARALRKAGFAAPYVIEIDQTWHLRAPETPFHALLHGGVRLAAILRRQRPEVLTRIEQSVAERAAPYLSDGVFNVPAPAVLAFARKPASARASQQMSECSSEISEVRVSVE